MCVIIEQTQVDLPYTCIKNSLSQSLPQNKIKQQPFFSCCWHNGKHQSAFSFCQPAFLFFCKCTCLDCLPFPTNLIYFSAVLAQILPDKLPENKDFNLRQAQFIAQENAWVISLNVTGINQQRLK